MTYAIKYDGRTIASSVGDKTQVAYNARLSLSANNAGQLRFLLPFGHVSYDVPAAMQGIVSVERDGEEIFFGRVATIKEDRQRSRVFTVEGAIAFFSDITMFHAASDTMTLAQLMQYAQQRSGIHYAADTEITLNTAEEDGDTIKDVLAGYVSSNGGYFYCKRDSDGVIHVYYTADSIATATQEIRDGDNLTDISIETDATDIVTRINASYGNVDREFSKNTENYGVHEANIEYDVDTLEALEAAAMADLDVLAEPQIIVSASAIDKSSSGEAAPIDLLNSVHTIARYHGIDDWLTVTAVDIDLSGTAAAKITLGKRKKTLTEFVG